VQQTVRKYRPIMWQEGDKLQQSLVAETDENTRSIC